MAAPRDIDVLIGQRDALLGELAGVGDLRPGTLQARYRRCGKPTCHCARGRSGARAEVGAGVARRGRDAQLDDTGRGRTVKDVAGDGRYELYKTTQRMDGPYHVKQHGFQVT